MRVVRTAFVAALVAVVAAGGALAEGHEEPDFRAPTAVVALIDTGINPYHRTFRDTSERAYVHPSKYIAGYPADAPALELSLDAASFGAALQRDCAVWRSVKPNTLYWIPGTKIIGAITTATSQSTTCSASSIPTGRIIDAGGHGTMVASRAASPKYGACRECLIVAVQGFSTASVRWAADNATWIDAQSNSWGPTAPLWVPAGGSNLVSDAAFVRDVEAAAQKHLAFWASGNGVLTRVGVVGHPTLIDPRMTPSVISVGGHDSGYINTWPDFPPHVVSDSCNSWAANHNSTTAEGDNVGGGTSGASPFAAGGATRMLLEARTLLGDTRTGVRDGVVAEGEAGAVASGPLADGKLTLAEWRALVLKTATARPVRQYEDGAVCEPVPSLVIYGSTPVQWKDVPAGYPEFVHIGYGAVDDPAQARALQVLRGEAPMPDRTATDAYFTADDATRRQLHAVYRTG